MAQDRRERTPVQGLGKNDKLTEDGTATAVSYRFDLIPPESLLAVAQVMHEGAEKGYEKDGWRRLTTEDHLNHAMGHIMAHLDGEEEEDHVAHAAARLLMAWATLYARKRPER